jgi:serine O-acetyltransferase
MTIAHSFESNRSDEYDIDRIVDALRVHRIRSHHFRYGSGLPPTLPSRASMMDIVDGLIAALFPRHFGPPGLAVENFDPFVRSSLENSLKALGAQVALAVQLGATRPVNEAGALNQSLEITAAFAEGLADIRGLLETDIRAAFDGDPAATSLDEVMCCYPGVAAIIRHRIAHRLYGLGLPILARIVSEAAHSATGIDIHPGAQIGESFFIDHGTGVVVGETSIIGRGLRLYQGVTLGARRFATNADGGLAKNYPRHPIIEDDVVIYAGASVLGRITVGKGSVIAGSVWLTEDVPAGSTVTQAKSRSAVEAIEGRRQLF